MSKIQVLRMVLHEVVQKISEKLHRFYFDQSNIKKFWMDLEKKVRRINIKGIEDYNAVPM